MSTPHLVVVGSANTDLVVSVPDNPAPGQTVLGGGLQTIPGGKGANQAVAIARLGGKVTFVGRVGDDNYGTTTRINLQREGIDTTYLQTTPHTPSGVALIAVQEGSGENAIVVAPGANACLTPADIEAASVAFDHADAIVLSLEVPLDAIAAAVQAAHTRGVPVFLNPAPAQILPDVVFLYSNYLLPNETECAFYGGRAALLARGVGAVIETRGSEGAVIRTATGEQSIPTFPVTAVDTVAAGDCFVGAFAVEVASGKSLPDAVHFACKAAALKVTRPGAQPGLPYRRDVLAMLG